MKNLKWSDDQIMEWAKIYVESRISLMDMESSLFISHSTLWWCFTHRLPGIDYKVSRVVNAKLIKKREESKLLFNIKVQNMPKELVEEYTVARLVDNVLWYYGQYNKERAEMVVKELGINAIMLKNHYRIPPLH